MPIRLGDIAPDFSADSTAGVIHFHDFLGDGWGSYSVTSRLHTGLHNRAGAVAALKAELDAQRKGRRPEH